MLRPCLIVLSLFANGNWTVSSFSVARVSCRPDLDRLIFRASSQDEDEFVRVPRRRKRGRFYDDDEAEEAFYDTVERNIYGDEDFNGGSRSDDEDDEDDEVEDEEDYGIFSDVLIDNPILDSIDPDGAAERFPELARDPRFWFDMVLFIAFLDLLSTIGPQNYFPDLPYYV